MKVYHYTLAANAINILTHDRFTLSAASRGSGDTTAGEKHGGASFYISFTTETDIDRGYSGRMRAPKQSYWDKLGKLSTTDKQYQQLWVDKGIKDKEGNVKGGEDLQDMVVRFSFNLEDLEKWKGVLDVEKDFDMKKYSTSDKPVDEKEVRIYSNLPVWNGFADYIIEVDFFSEKLGTTYDKKIQDRHRYQYLQLEKLCKKYGIPIQYNQISFDSRTGKLLPTRQDITKNLSHPVRSINRYMPPEVGSKPGKEGTYNISEKIGKLFGNIFGTLKITDKSKITRIIENILEPYCSTAEIDQAVQITLDNLTNSTDTKYKTLFKNLINTRSNSGREIAIAKTLEELVYRLSKGSRNLPDVLTKTENKIRNLTKLRYLLQEALGTFSWDRDEDDQDSLDDYLVGEDGKQKAYYFPKITQEIADLVKEEFGETVQLFSKPVVLVNNGNLTSIGYFKDNSKPIVVFIPNFSDKLTKELNRRYPVHIIDLENPLKKGISASSVLRHKRTDKETGISSWRLKSMREWVDEVCVGFSFKDIEGTGAAKMIEDQYNTYSNQYDKYEINGGTLIVALPNKRFFNGKKAGYILTFDCNFETLQNTGKGLGYSTDILNYASDQIDTVAGVLRVIAKDEEELGGVNAAIRSLKKIISKRKAGKSNTTVLLKKKGIRETLYCVDVHGDTYNLVSLVETGYLDSLSSNLVDLPENLSKVVFVLTGYGSYVLVIPLEEFYKEPMSLERLDFLKTLSERGDVAVPNDPDTMWSFYLHSKSLSVTTEKDETRRMQIRYLPEKDLCILIPEGNPGNYWWAFNYKEQVFCLEKNSQGKINIKRDREKLANYINSSDFEKVKDVFKTKLSKKPEEEEKPLDKSIKMPKLYRKLEEEGKLQTVDVEVYKSKKGRPYRLQQDGVAVLPWSVAKDYIRGSCPGNYELIKNELQEEGTRVDKVYVWDNNGSWNCLIPIQDKTGKVIEVYKRKGYGQGLSWSLLDLQ